MNGNLCLTMIVTVCTCSYTGHLHYSTSSSSTSSSSLLSWSWSSLPSWDLGHHVFTLSNLPFLLSHLSRSLQVLGVVVLFQTKSLWWQWGSALCCLAEGPWPILQAAQRQLLTKESPLTRVCPKAGWKTPGAGSTNDSQGQPLLWVGDKVDIIPIMRLFHVGRKLRATSAGTLVYLPCFTCWKARRQRDSSCPLATRVFKESFVSKNPLYKMHEMLLQCSSHKGASILFFQTEEPQILHYNTVAFWLPPMHQSDFWEIRLVTQRSSRDTSQSLN